MQMNLRTFVLASAALATAALTAIPAMAATAGATILHVPFTFSVAGKTLAAGDYKVKRDTENMITLQSADGSQSFAAWVTNAAPQNDGRVVLRFSGDGQVRSLESVQYGALVTPRLAKHSKKAEDITPENVVGR